MAGNTLTSARQITVASNAQTFSDWVGSADTNDYYRFSVSETSNFNLTLNGLSSNADVQLLNSSGTAITSSNAAGTSSETISRQLVAGTYFIRVYPYSGNTAYNLSLSSVRVVPPNTDWYGQNLRDSELITLTRSLAADGNLSRNDMMSIFRNTQDSGVVDANELTDLRTLLNNASRFTMQNHVVVLANKIANGNVANINSGIGNLSAGSSAAHMENLIGKWFLGNDRPDLTNSSYTYRETRGSLFQNGIRADDVNQGAVGDCYYLATLSSIAQEQSSYIQNMFIDNGDNTFTVRFFNNGVADYVTVDRYLPTNSSGNLVYASRGSNFNNSSNELWVALAERAYAQLAESGWSRSNSTNSYAAIEGGWMDAVIRQVTGVSASSQFVSSMTRDQLINLVRSNQILTAGFVYGGGYGVVNSHAYTITAYNEINQTFQLRNPWGHSHAEVTWEQLLSLSARIQWSNFPTA